MVARNDVTGDKIQTKGVSSEEYKSNFDRIFGKKNKESPELEHKTLEEEMEVKRKIGG